MHTRTVSLLLLTAFASAPAFAQEKASGADIERLKFPSDHYGYFATESAETLGHLQVGMGAWFNYAHKPMELIDANGDPVPVVPGQEGGAIDARTTAEFQLGVGITSLFSLSASLPVVLSQTGYDISDFNDLSTPAALSGNALGDIRVTPKLAPVSRDDFPLGVALLVPIGLPTGDPASYTGAGGLTVSPTLAVEFSDGSVWARDYRWRSAVNLGYSIRPDRRIRDVAVGNALLYRVAFGFRPADIVELTADVHGESWGASVAQSPLELDLGGKFVVGRWTTLNLAGGIGLVPGVGTPDLRVLAGATFAPSFDKNARDTDKDGVSDGLDQCPKHAEDLDGFQDEDGCPEDDNDGDGVEDAVDQCPNDTEDDDGYRDMDGCPDPDNDLDGIPDMSDRCPDDAETINGFEDADGCPDDQPVSDSDGDGYDDDVDRCPYDAEDMDGFEDLDGCPEEDNDRDGIMDIQDQCPDVKETYNGNADDDGCPDAGASRVEVKADRIEISEKIYFETGKGTIKTDSYSLLNEIAGVLRANDQIKLVRIEGHTDSDGSDVANLKLSQDRAKAVLDYLVEQGVEAERLSSAGFGETMPIADNGSSSGKAENRRVEFIILRVE